MMLQKPQYCTLIVDEHDVCISNPIIEIEEMPQSVSAKISMVGSIRYVTPHEYTTKNIYMPTRILRSGDRVIVFWSDNSKTIVKRSVDTADDIYSAFTAALAIKMYGSNSALKRMIRKKTEFQKKKEKKHEKVTD